MIDAAWAALAAVTLAAGSAALRARGTPSLLPYPIPYPEPVGGGDGVGGDEGERSCTFRVRLIDPPTFAPEELAVTMPVRGACPTSGDRVTVSPTESAGTGLGWGGPLEGKVI